jgi:hypothetical protein
MVTNLSEANANSFGNGQFLLCKAVSYGWTRGRTFVAIATTVPVRTVAAMKVTLATAAFTFTTIRCTPMKPGVTIVPAILMRAIPVYRKLQYYKRIIKLANHKLLSNGLLMLMLSCYYLPNSTSSNRVSGPW